MIRQKSQIGPTSKLPKTASKLTKKRQQKIRKRRENFDEGVTSEDENSDDIEYDNSGADVAGADEADSVGEAADTVGGLQGLQEPHQVNLFVNIEKCPQVYTAIKINVLIC